MSETIKRRLRADVERGFIDLVDAYGSMVLSIGSRLGDRDVADDIAQETFTRAYRSINERDDLGDLDLRPWLATIALNLVRNEQRRRIRRPTAPLPDTLADRLVAPGKEVEDRVLDGEAVMALETMLDCLPHAQREAIVLRHVVGLSTKETATVMDCSPGTVKSHLSRGLGALRRNLTTGNGSTEEKTI